MIARINLGMDNASKYGIGYLEMVSLLSSAIRDYGKIDCTCSKMSKGGDWKPEPILIADIDVSEWVGFNRALEALCVVLNEDSIAVSLIGREGYLIFHPNYAGERYPFNFDYFLN